jgi:hypothetical protein
MKPAGDLRPQKRPIDILAARFVLVPIHLQVRRRVLACGAGVWLCSRRGVLF